MNSICIFSDPNWSKFSSSSGFLPVLKAGMKPGNKDFERALGRKVKNPRERMLKGINLKEGEQHLGPPMIGKVAGHGINVSGTS